LGRGGQLKICEFYKESGENSDKEKNFWSNLGKEEVRHAENIRKMEDIFSSRSERFEENRTRQAFLLQFFAIFSLKLWAYHADMKIV
jgi:hypothetical protein